MRLIAYYQVELTADTINLYHQCLADYDVELIASAASIHVKSSKWFPKISELVSLMKPHIPRIESKATEQAAIVLQAIRSYGYNHEPIWSDPITNYLLKSRFNWKSICNTLTEEEEKWFVKNFNEAYLSAADISQGDMKQLDAPEQFKQLAMGLFESIH